MITELRLKSQVTIPKMIVEKLGLEQGDQLEIKEEDGAIKITPVVVYPKKVIDELKRESKQAKADLKAGKLKKYKTVETLLAALRED